VTLLAGNSGSTAAPDGTTPTVNDVTVQDGSGTAQQMLVLRDSNVKFRGAADGVADTTGAITVQAGSLSSFDMVGYPNSLTAGSNFGSNNVTVTARDLYGNLKTNYTGTVTWSTTDSHSGVTLPADYTFTSADQGSRTFAGTEFQLNTAGGQTITVTDATENVSETSGAITVSHATLNAFTLSAPASVTAGDGFVVNVTGAQDAYGNDWSGTITVTTPTGGNPAPNGSTPTISDITVANGSGSAEQVLVKTEQTVFQGSADGTTATDTVDVSPGILGSFTLTGYPAGVVAGNSFGSNDVTVTALDIFDNTKTDYGGSIYFTSTDANASLPHTSTLPYTFQSGDQGTRTFSGTTFILNTVGTQTISVTDGSKTTASDGISVSSGNIADFTLSVGTTQTAGTPFLLSATNVVDASGNPVDGLITVTIATGGGDSPNGTTPTLQDITVTNGSGSAQQTLVNAITTSLRGTAGTVSKTTDLITVNPASLDAFSIDNLSNATAGTSFTINVTGIDAYGNTATGFTGTGTISDKTGTVSPTSISITNGTGSESVTITEAGVNNAITVTADGKSGTSNTFDVAPAALNYFTMTGYPTSVTAGVDFGSNDVVVTAYDQYDNRKTDYSGQVYFTSTDGSAVLPYTSSSPYSFTTSDSGRKIFPGTGFTLNTSGDQTITVTDGTISETSSTIVVSTSNIDNFQLNVGTTQTAGTAFTLSVVNAVDASGNPASGVVTVSIASGGGSSPDGSTPILNNINVIDGSGSAQQTLFRTVTTVLRGTAGSVSVDTNPITVQPAALGSFSTATISSPQTAGVAFTVSDTAKDLYGNKKTDFNGTATLTDLTGDLNTSMSFSNGVGSKSVTITKTRTANVITITSGNVASTSNSFDVQPGPLDTFVFDEIGPQQAGVAFKIKVTAKDPYGNVKTDFSGTVALSVNQGSIDPTSMTINNGIDSTNVTINTAGSDYQITATSGSVSGTSNFFNVTSSAVTSFEFDPISSQAAGEPFSITITAKDQFGNRVFDFEEKVDLSDLTGTLTPDSSGAFNAGAWTGNVTITQVLTGNTISAAFGSATGTSNAFDVTSVSIDHFAVTDTLGNDITDKVAGAAFDLMVVAQDANNNTVTSFTGTVEISDVSGTITPTISGNFVNGVWKTGSVKITKAQANNKITVTGSGRSGTSAIFNVSPGPLAGFVFDDITSPQQAGVPFSVTITAVDSFDNTVTGFTGKVGLTSNAGSVSPDSSGSFVAGVWTDFVKLVQSQTDVRLTATAAGGKTGTSNFFNVNPGALARFDISPINTQFVNEAFNITVTAKDTMGNTVTGFDGTVDISDLTGTISPTVSGNFALGQWTGQVAISVETANDTITVRNSAGTEEGKSNGFAVQIGPGFRITEFRVSQPTVTSGQTRDWTLTMVVSNPSADPVTLDSVRVEVSIANQDVTSEYTFGPYPTTFLGSGTATLAGNTSDSLRITVDRTGTTTGSAAVLGIVWATGVGQERAERFAQVEVQSPAQLVINQVIPSRSTVTQGQTLNWTVDVAVTNTGGSDVTIDFSAAKTDLLFNPATGFSYQRPTALKSGGVQLAAGATDTLVYTVTVTGNQAGEASIGAKVAGVENNSGIERSDDTSDSGAGSVTVQTPPDIRLLMVRALFNGIEITRVNTGQRFLLQVQVRNDGEEEAQGVKIEFGTSGSSTWSPTTITLPSVPGSSTRTGLTTFTAANTPSPSDTFFARIVEATGANTQEIVAPSPPTDSSAVVLIETPAALNIPTITLATDTISAFQANWEIRVSVSNTGDAALTLDPPAASDLKFEIENQEQIDYIVQPPESFLEGGLNLPGGTTKTLRYLVTRAGALGGNGRVTVSLRGKDANDGNFRTAEAQATYAVVTSASVRLASVIVDAPNVDVTGRGFVNTQQPFGVRATIENLGQESVLNVGVSISTTGNSTLPAPASVVIDSISGNGQKTVRFDIVAAAVENLQGETFTVRVDSAEAAESGGRAIIRQPLDSTAVVRIERPAALSIILAADAVDTNFTVGSTFTVRALVENAGQAQVDNTGRLTLQVPDNYSIVEPLPDLSEQSFTVGEWVTWGIQAPAVPSLDDTLVATFVQIPKDLNTAQPAFLLQNSDTLRVSTLGTNLEIVDIKIISPAGARDSTISSEQEFVVQVNTDFSPNLRDVTATLNLPDGFSFILGAEDSTRSLSRTTKSASWRLRAPDNARIADSLRVHVVGFDDAGARTDTVGVLEVNTVLKANLRVDMFVGTRQNNVRVATGQRFDITAVVFNDGTASVEGPARLRLDVGSSGITLPEGNDRDFTVNQPVTWSAFAPSTPTDVSVLKVSMIAIPRDENTGRTASVSKPNDNLSIQTVDTGSLTLTDIRIIDPPGAQDGTLSTGQRFVVAAEVSYESATNVAVKLDLPDGYFTENQVRPASASPAIVQWRVDAPGLPLGEHYLKVIVTGNDENNPEVPVPTVEDSIRVVVQSRARLEVSTLVSDPPTARDNIVSAGQPFEVTATVVQRGQAGVAGPDSLILTVPESEGFRIAGAAVQAVVDGKATWQVLAPDSPTGIRNLAVNYVRVPVDTNSNQPAQVIGVPATTSVQVEKIALRVSELPPQRGASATRGAQNVPFVGLRLENTGGEGSNDIMVTELNFSLWGADGELSPRSVISRVTIADYNDPDQVFAVLQAAEIPGSNPVKVSIDPALAVGPTEPDSVVILVDIATAAEVTSFFLKLGGDAIVAEDQYSGLSVDLFDPTNQKFVELNSSSSTLVEADFNKAFGNYPNPFGRVADKTFFVYYLDRPADVRIEIYTLLGELVWSASYSASDPEGQEGLHDKDVVWDGRNGAGRRVLDGVYIARITTSTGLEATTKIAVVK
jgi:hypothetical protein